MYLSVFTYQAQSHRNSSKTPGNFATNSKQTFLKIKEEPLNEKTASRKHLAFQEASSSIIKTKLKDMLGRVPWNNNAETIASYADGVGGLSQERLQAIMNQLTNDIRVNGRRVTPLQAQIVQQSSNGAINPTSTDLNDMQNDMMSNLQDAMQPNMQDNMQDDVQSNRPNGMQDDVEGESEVKPIQIPMNQKGGNNVQSMSPSSFERLMFGSLSEIVGGGGGRGGGGGGGGGGGMSNVPGLSFGGRHTPGVINLMESQNGLKPMKSMNGMSAMNGMFTGMHGMTMNGMGMMNGMNRMHQMERMGGRMWGGGSFFSRRGETSTHKKNGQSKGKVPLQKADKVDSISAPHVHKTNEHDSTNYIHLNKHATKHEAKPSILRLIPDDTPLPAKKINSKI